MKQYFTLWLHLYEIAETKPQCLAIYSGDKTSSSNFFAFLYKVKTVVSLWVVTEMRTGEKVGVLLGHLQCSVSIFVSVITIDIFSL